MHALAERSGSGPKPLRFSFDDVLKMVDAGIIDEDARIELLDGELIEMAPQLTAHARAKSLLARLIAMQLAPDHEYIVDATMRFGPRQVTEPDLYFYPTGLRHDALRGPDLLLIIEVADSSLGYDLGTKARFYARQGVIEYWVLDVATRETAIHRGPGPSGYRDVTIQPPSDPVSPLDARGDAPHGRPAALRLGLRQGPSGLEQLSASRAG